ncbi:MAG: hypothetical protein J1F07_05835 [Muribaculaceae bacterium]|nr:hypothetical protein [Muribaculaceae bacterium]
MLRRAVILATAIAAAALSAAAAPFTPPADILEARELCDHADLRPIEGLWSYPEDDVTVLVYRSDEKKGTYDIHVVEAADCSLKPGMKLGELASTADPDKYTLRLFTRVKKGILTAPSEALATYSENKEALTVKRTNKFSLRFNPTRLLPSFWRLISVNIRPGDPAPEGLIKVYPSYDGNNSTRRGPRYL